MLVLLALTSSSFAGVDTYGLGNGQDGAAVISAPTVVNDYASITASAFANDTQIVVSDASAFSAGELVLIHRSIGLVATSGDQTELDLSAGDVGRFELARIVNVAGTTLTLDAPLVAGIVADEAKVVSLPE